MSLSFRRIVVFATLWVACEAAKPSSVAVELHPLGKLVALPTADQAKAAIEVQRNAHADWRREGDDVPVFAGDRARTAAAEVAVLRLDSGAELALNGGSEVQVAAATVVKLDKGELWLSAKTPVTVETAQGSVLAKNGMGSVRFGDGRLAVSWVSGRAQIQGKAGAVMLAAGEEGTADASGVRRSYIKDAASLLAWTERVRRAVAPPAPDDGSRYGRALAGGLGTMSAKVPGSSKPLPFHILGEDVQIRIQDHMAVTRVEQIFRNPTSQVVEGEYRFPIPENAMLTGYDMEVNGRLVRGEIVERERGRKILKQVEDEWLWRMRDPALTEWESGTTFKTRIFPIKPQEEKRIVLTHVQPLAGAAGEYRYVLPLAMGATDSPVIQRLRIKATVGSSAGAPAVTVPIYAVRRTPADNAVKVEYEAEATRPLVDFTMTIRAPAAKEASLSTFGKGATVGAAPALQLTDLNTFVRAAEEDTFLLRLSPTFAASDSAAAGADWLFLVDTSESRFGPDMEVEKAMLTTLLDTLGPEDRVKVMAFDTFPVPMDPAWAPPTPALKQRCKDFLTSRKPGGASNLGDALRAARQAADPGRPLKVLVLGDGVTTLGETTPAALAGLAARLFDHPHSVSAVAIGASMDRLLLGTLAQRTHGRYFAISAGEELFTAATRVVLGLRAPVLESPTLSFAGLSVREVLPATLPNVASGSDLLVAGRYQGTGKLVATLAGTLGGKPWRKEWTFDVGQAHVGNGFVPLVYAAHKLDALALDNSKAAERELVALSKKYGIATRLTSFIVLENEAMFREFHVDRNERVAWSGDGGIDYEDQGESAAAGGALAKEDKASAGAGAGTGAGEMGKMGARRGAPEHRAAVAGKAEAPPAPRPAAAVAPSAAEDEHRHTNPFNSSAAPEPVATAPAPKTKRMAAEMSSPFGDVSYPAGPTFHHYRPRPQWLLTVRQLAAAPSPAALDKARGLEAAVHAAPMDRRARKALVTWLIASALLDEASRALADWAAIDRSNPEVHLLAGDVLKLHGDVAGALRAYSSVLDLRPENQRVLGSLAAYYEARGEWQAAHPFRVSLATLQPKSTAARVDVAVTALRAGRTDDAVRVTDELVDSDHGGYARLKRGVSLARADRDIVLSIRSAQSLPLLYGNSVASDLRSAGLRVTMTWDRPADVDLWMSTGRDSYVGGALGKTRLLTNASGQERVFFVSGGAQGRYRAQVLCRDSRGCDALSGRLVIEAHGERRTVPFVLSGHRGRDVASIRITQPPPRRYDHWQD